MTLSSHESVLAHRRIVVKAGTNVLTGRTERLDQATLASLAEQIACVRRKGAQVVLVTSGAIAAGRESLRDAGDTRVVERQVLAAVGQGKLMHAYQELFARHGITVAQALLTRHDVEDRQGYLNVRGTLEGLLEHGVLPVVNENDVVDTAEIGQERFGDNDTLSALVANLVDADLLLLLTDTGGLFTADPHRDPSAALIERVERIDDSVLAMAEPSGSTSAGRGGMLSKLEAARRATAAGIVVVVASGAEPGVVARAAAGTSVGTLFSTNVNQMESRKRWLLSGMAEGGGQLVVDDGAVTALRARHGSLLPAGLRDVRGFFRRGDVVAVITESGEQVACGISSYGGEDLRVLRGARSTDITKLLGHHYGDEVIHRNNMVVL